MNKGNSEVIITSEDIFDESKFVLDEKDKNRIEKNISFLKLDDIPFNRNMRTIPINSNTVIKSEEEILNRLIIDFTIALFAKYSKNEDKLLNVAFNKIDEKLGVRKLLTNKDILIIDKILDGKCSKNELENLELLFEDVNVYMWALGFISKPVSRQVCNVNEITKILFKSKNYLNLLFKCNLKSKSELLEYADLVNRYLYACREYEMNGKTQDKLIKCVVERQVSSINYVVSYDLNNFIKDNLKITCVKGDLDFSFLMKSNLSFRNVEGDKELLSLYSEDKKTQISMSDMGKCSRYDYDYKCDNIEKSLNTNGYKVINKCYFTNDNSSIKNIQLVVEGKDIAFNSYLLCVSDHILKIDSMIDKYIDYKDFNILNDSDNSTIDRSIIFSIIDNKKLKEKIIKRDYDYSDIVCSFDNLNKIIDFENKLYDKFDSLFVNSNIKKIGLDGIKIFIIDREYNTQLFKNYYEYIYAYNNKEIKNVNSISIELNLNYEKNNNEFKNKFVIDIKPFNVKFQRVSNNELEVMDQIEDAIKKLINSLSKEVTIFNYNESEKE